MSRILNAGLILALASSALLGRGPAVAQEDQQRPPAHKVAQKSAVGNSRATATEKAEAAKAARERAAAAHQYESKRRYSQMQQQDRLRIQRAAQTDRVRDERTAQADRQRAQRVAQEQHERNYPTPHRTAGPCKYPMIQKGLQDKANYIIGTVASINAETLRLFDKQRGYVNVNIANVPADQRSSISQGDYVLVRGGFSGNTFVATAFKTNPSQDDLASGQNPCGIYTDIQKGQEDKASYVIGTVTDDSAGRRFTIYDNNRGNVTVDARNVMNFPVLRSGDHVRVTGAFRGYVFYATGVFRH
ncbi:MAG: hypothetical protein M3126_03020 [Candidatus Eremiobacteraeota bacterium]|nr:hypothetical protein [Candidatus Eremiobacteraeota bacterium]